MRALAGVALSSESTLPFALLLGILLLIMISGLSGNVTISFLVLVVDYVGGRIVEVLGGICVSQLKQSPSVNRIHETVCRSG